MKRIEKVAGKKRANMHASIVINVPHAKNVHSNILRYSKHEILESGAQPNVWPAQHAPCATVHFLLT